MYDLELYQKNNYSNKKLYFKILILIFIGFLIFVINKKYLFKNYLQAESQIDKNNIKIVLSDNDYEKIRYLNTFNLENNEYVFKIEKTEKIDNYNLLLIKNIYQLEDGKKKIYFYLGEESFLRFLIALIKEKAK